MALAVEDIVNMALDAIGYSKHVGDILEGSPAARVALEVYSQTRDECIQNGDWPWCLREVLLTTNGQTPPTPWAHEYTYPTDCIRIRYIRPGPLTGGSRDNDPQPVLYRPWNDQRTNPASQAILCDLASPVLIYNGRVTNPATWDTGFIEALVSALAVKMSVALTEQAEMLKLRLAISAKDTKDGMTLDDLSAPPPEGPDSGKQH